MVHQWDKICFQSLSTNFVSFIKQQAKEIAKELSSLAPTVGEVKEDTLADKEASLLDKGWHRGNYKDSLPGKPIKDITEF